MEKSAEVIVLTGNELGQYPRGLTSKEGPNVKSRLDSYRNHLFDSLYLEGQEQYK